MRRARSRTRLVAYAVLGTAVVTAVALLPACGRHPGGPTPSPSPSPSGIQLGGTVAGAYLIQLTPGPGCAMSRAPLTFPMAAAAAGASPHPGVQVLLDPNPFRLEMELLSAVIAVRGGLGTTEEGVLANEGFRLWVHAIGSGPVQRAVDGRGEVVTGTLSGYLALANADGEQGSLGTCTATDHAFTLRRR